MACHPSGITFDVVGIRASSNGRSCENHECCGVALEEDMVITPICIFGVIGGLIHVDNEGLVPVFLL